MDSDVTCGKGVNNISRDLNFWIVNSWCFDVLRFFGVRFLTAVDVCVRFVGEG